MQEVTNTCLRSHNLNLGNHIDIQIKLLDTGG